MIPYGHQSIGEDDISAVVEVLRSDYITQGPKVAEFERKLAEYCGAKYSVAVSNGTTALHLAYLAAGLKTGDEVITTPNTFVATTNMLLAVGAKPVFCDIRSDTYNIDETKIESLITSKTKAIVPVHFAGQPCAMDKIWKIAHHHKLLVIEDAAHALGALHRGQKIGGGKSNLITFSFHPIKTITTGEGGAIVTNSKALYKKMMLLRSHGVTKNRSGIIVMHELGYNYRITDFQCALGSSQLKRIRNFTSKRHQVIKWYEKCLSDNQNLTLPIQIDDNYSSCHLYVVLVKDAKKRLPLVKHLLRNQVGVNLHYPPVYSHPYYRNNGYMHTKCKQADDYFFRCITLPLYVRMTKKQVSYIANKIDEFFKS